MWVYNSAVKGYSISNLMLSYRWLNSSASSSLCSMKMRICVITSSLATFSRCFIKGTDTDTDNLKINNYVHWQSDTARIHPPCCCVPCSIRSISPAGRIHSSKATAAGLLLCAVQHSIDISCWLHPQQQSYSSGFAAVCRAAFDRYLLPAGSTAAKLQQRVWAPAETDRRTTNRCIQTLLYILCGHCR